MARKRPGDFIDMESSQESDDIDFGVGFESQHDSYMDGLHGSENSCGGGPAESHHADYDAIMKDYAAIKVLKRKLALGLSHLQDKGFRKPKDAFTRFSITGFSTVIDALTPDYKKVIEDYGFGALLHFDNCIVPESFAKWVAGLVNYRSGDIIFNDKVISLTKETVHLVLGLPLTEKPFPHDPLSGMSVVLSKFNKKSVPSVSFFANKLLQHEPMCDEDVFICFIIVALNNFLCPYHSDIPCVKYFGIFDDIKNAKELDWCGYILEWLLQGVKNFNSAKASKPYDGGVIDGCIYYLSVIYLDHVNFGARQLPHTIPRISVWKGAMIKEYAGFDLKSTGCYGCHPLVDTSQSCYSKDLRNLNTAKSFCLDSDFNDRLDKFAGYKLPGSLKVNICKLVQKHCLNSGLSVNMDVQSINGLPDDMKITFCKLLKHAYSIDSRSQKLVLDAIKILCQSTNEDFTDNADDEELRSESDCTQQTANIQPPVAANGHANTDELDNPFDSGICPQRVAHESIPSSYLDVLSSMRQTNTPPPAINDNNADDANDSLPLPVPNLDRSVLKIHPKVKNVDVDRVMQKLIKSSSGNFSTIARNPSQSQIPLSSNSNAQSTHSSKHGCHKADKKRIPLDDLSNEISTKRKKTLSFSPQVRSHVDLAMLQNENFYVPDSLSPVSIPGRRRFISDKDLLSLQKTHLSSVSSPTDSSDHSNGFRASLSQLNCQDLSSQFQAATKVSPEVQIIGERTLADSVVSPEVQIIGERTVADSVCDISKKSGALHTSKLRMSKGTMCTPIHLTENIPSSSRPLSSNLAPSLAYRARDSTTVTNLSTRGPRRSVQSGGLFVGQDVTKSAKYHVSNSEVQNYEDICSLVFSEYQGEDAVYLYGVRCTFWSLGESLKPNGQVQSFVVSVFCYSLFMKPIRHSDASKRYYFFPNIADNLLRNFDEADQEVLSRAFKRYSKCRPLNHSNMLFFPTSYDEHWFVFVVDIKERKYIILDSLFKENDAYQQGLSFEYHFQKLLQVDIDFKDFDLIYPAVPSQPPGHGNDSGIYAMMFLEHWVSTKTALSSLFGPKDIPNIRLKLQMILYFNPKILE